MGIEELRQIQRAQDQTKNQDKLRSKVCIYWLQGNCKRGKNCDYLHAHITEKIPICSYFRRFGDCEKKPNCPYRHHKDPHDFQQQQAKQTDTIDLCPYYDRGYCHKGNDCKFYQKHMLSVIYFSQGQDVCPFYLAGFCPYGPNCNQKHLKSVVIDEQASLRMLANFPDSENWVQHSFTANHKGQHGLQQVICHNCGEPGHKSTFCLEDPIDPKKIDIDPTCMKQTQCFHCKQMGHYASHCP